MSSYVGRHSELYDIFYADKPYEKEAVFINQCIRQHSIGETRSLLELACGTGSHALALEKFGYNIVGTDYSEDMLGVARIKAAKSFSRVDFRLQDMRDLHLSDPPFDAAICLFDSIGYASTTEAIKNILKGLHDHLRPEGLFILEFWHASAMLRNYEPLRIRRWSIHDMEIMRISETELEYDKQLAHVTYTIYELRKDGTYSIIKETQTNRYFLVQEMKELLLSCSFKPLEWFAGFTESKNISDETWHIVVIARRR